MNAPAFKPGQAVNVRPPMTPLACHRGRILRRCKNGWRAGGDDRAGAYARRFAQVYTSEAAAQSAVWRWLGWSDGGAFWNSERASAAAAKVAWRGWSYALEYQDREATAAKLEGVV